MAGVSTVNYDPFIIGLAGELAHAIALAEGFYVEGSLPQRIHNPGDLELGDRGWGVNNGKTIYSKADVKAEIDDRTDGYSALKRECLAILTGSSFEYRPENTFEYLAGGEDGKSGWTGGDNPGAWVRIVTEKLQVDPMDRIVDWIKARQSS